MTEGGYGVCYPDFWTGEIHAAVAAGPFGSVLCVISGFKFGSWA